MTFKVGSLIRPNFRDEYLILTFEELGPRTSAHADSLAGYVQTKFGRRLTFPAYSAFKVLKPQHLYMVLDKHFDNAQEWVCILVDGKRAWVQAGVFK